MEFRDSKVAEVDAEDAAGTTTRVVSKVREPSKRAARDVSKRPSAADNPPPFKPALAGVSEAPWHAYGDVAAWEPEFRALASALDRGRALGEWNLAFAHLRAGARRALARCRAEQYARFAELLERLAADETRRDETGDETGDETRALRLSTLREKLATTETDHAARILRVTFGRRAVAEKQLRRRRDGTRGEESARRGADAGGDAFLDENEDDDASLLAGESDMADPPTRAEMLAATRVLRGCWVHAPASCAAAGAAGAADALTRALEPVGAPPPPPRDSPSDLLQRALEQWRLDRGDGVDSRRAPRVSRADVSDEYSPPPLKVAFPEGRGEDGEAPAAVSIGWDVDDPETAFGQPSPDAVRCEILEALLSLMARDESSRAAFLARGGVQTAAGYLVPWLAEERDEPPGELVQRCIVFLGVLIRHVLPTPRDDRDGALSLAARAEATLEATIGAETTAEILEAAEDLHDVGDEGEASGDDASESASPRGVSPRRPSSREDELAS